MSERPDCEDPVYCGMSGASCPTCKAAGEAELGPKRQYTKKVDKPTDKDLGFKQKNYKIHLNDDPILTKLLEDDEVSFQGFVDACVSAYLRGDPKMMKVVRDWKALKNVPKEHQGLYQLSHREREALFAELIKEEKK